MLLPQFVCLSLNPSIDRITTKLLLNFPKISETDRIELTRNSLLDFGDHLHPVQKFLHVVQHCEIGRYYSIMFNHNIVLLHAMWQSTQFAKCAA